MANFATSAAGPGFYAATQQAIQHVLRNPSERVIGDWQEGPQARGGHPLGHGQDWPGFERQTVGTRALQIDGVTYTVISDEKAESRSPLEVGTIIEFLHGEMTSLDQRMAFLEGAILVSESQEELTMLRKRRIKLEEAMEKFKMVYHQYYWAFARKQSRVEDVDGDPRAQMFPFLEEALAKLPQPNPFEEPPPGHRGCKRR